MRRKSQTLLISKEQSGLLDNVLRMKIFEMLLEKPKTTQQIVLQISESFETVDFHIQKLVQGKLIELVDEKVVAGVIAQYYLAHAQLFYHVEVVNPELDLDASENPAHKTILAQQFKKKGLEADIEALRYNNILSRQWRFI